MLQAYARSIAQCMMDATQGPETNPSALSLINKWVGEQSNMRAYLAEANLRNYLAYTTSRLDGSPGHNAAQLSDVWYQGILVSLIDLACSQFAWCTCDPVYVARHDARSYLLFDTCCAACCECISNFANLHGRLSLKVRLHRH